MNFLNSYTGLYIIEGLEMGKETKGGKKRKKENVGKI